MRQILFPAAVLIALASAAHANEYKVDPEHTYPSFVADHMGLDHWRGKFNATSGTIRLDREKGEGTVELAIDPASIDYGLDKLNDGRKGRSCSTSPSTRTRRTKACSRGFATACRRASTAS